MGGTPRLVRRGGVFYFRMAVPKDLVEVVGRGEVKTTLNTTDRVKATLLCRKISNDMDLLFANKLSMTPDAVAFGMVALRDAMLDLNTIRAQVVAEGVK